MYTILQLQLLKKKTKTQQDMLLGFQNYSSILLHMHLCTSMNDQPMTSSRLHKLRKYSMIGLLLCYTCLQHKEYTGTVSPSLVMSSTSLHCMV